MKEQWMQHIGDDQLVNGMPKHMVGVSASMEQKKSGPVPGDPPYRTRPKKAETGTFWTVHPKDKACDKCKAMAGIQFEEEPERPQPNCKCEIQKHSLRRSQRYITGSLTGHSHEVFSGGRDVRVSFQGISGGLASGIHLRSNHGHSKQIACMPFSRNSTTLVVDQAPPVTWRISLTTAGSDNVMIFYTIEYEDWNE